MTAVHKKLVKSKSGLRIVAVGSDELSPFHLDEPPWTPDRETADCGRCRSKFDFITRRHHCRRCGRVYCGSCCSRRLPLQRMCFVDPVRICHDCSPVTLRENDFYDRHLRLLLAGAHFLVSAPPDTAAVPHSCRLSADHRALEVENCQSGECTAIPLVSIASHRLLRPSSPSIGDSPRRAASGSDGGLSGVMLGYRPQQASITGRLAGCPPQQEATDEAMNFLQLALSPVPEVAAQGALWIVALNKAFRMIHSPDTSPD